jgi:hypothetical protein
MMKREQNQRVVADGQERIQATGAYKLAKRELWSRIRNTYEDKRTRTVFLWKWLIWLQIWCEFRRELQKLAPDDAFYFNT